MNQSGMKKIAKSIFDWALAACVVSFVSLICVAGYVVYVLAIP